MTVSKPPNKAERDTDQIHLHRPQEGGSNPTNILDLKLLVTRTVS